MAYLSVKLEDVPVVSYQLGGPDTREDFFNFGTQASREASTPSISEIVVTKTTDSSSPSLFEAAACTNNLVDGSEHTGGANFAMGDGSVRFINSHSTVDYLDLI